MFPSAPEPPRAALTACAEAIRSGSRSFHAASRLLPAHVREPALALYAFCRQADDQVDLGDEPAAATARLRVRLDRAYAGRPADAPADHAFAWIVARHDLPRALPEALIEGLEWDAAGRRYRDLEELAAYAARVAGAVGAMMAVLMRARSPAQLARACDLGVAMQFTNIARDVGEDARAGRLYLPTRWLEATETDPEAFLADPRPTPEIRAVTRRLLDEAARLYRRSDPGIRRLPRGCRGAILAARLIYASIGDEIARRGHDSVTRRAVTSPGRKLALASAAAIRAAAPTWSRAEECSPLPQCAFLVEAAAAPEPASRGERLIDLITELEWRDRRARAAIAHAAQGGDARLVCAIS